MKNYKETCNSQDEYLNTHKILLSLTCLFY